MQIVAIAWIYIALMMALAEATNPQGSVLGAVITFILYGLAPLALVMYLLGAPVRRKARRAEEAQEQARRAAAQGGSADADAGGLTSGDAIAPEREEP